MAADENALGHLHTRVATVLTELLDGTPLPTGQTDEDGNEIMQTLPPSAAVITSAIQFLKNNNITCTPAKDNALGALREKIEQRENRRKQRMATPADLSLASDDADFLSSRPN